MKKLIKQILALFFVFCSLQAKEPIIKFHLNDGTIKEYGISEISNISFIKSEISSIMTVYGKADTLTRYFSTDIINNIEFENQRIKFILADTIIYQNLSEIDSIIIWPKEQRYISVMINSEIPNLKLLKVSSYADYNRKFDTLGNSKVLISANGLPQMIMVSDTANNLIAMGIAKSTDSTIYINGFSSITALVFQNAFMMGMTLEQGTDSVVDFIQSLGEVSYIASFVDDTINIGRPFMNALDSNLKAILREAYLKTYEYATGDTSLAIDVLAEKDKSDKLLNQDIPVEPSEAAGIKITAEQNDQGIIQLKIENKKKRHISIKICDFDKYYGIGPKSPITGSLLSKILDFVLYSNVLIKDTLMPSSTICQIQTSGPALYSSSHHFDHNDPFYLDAYLRTTVSLLSAPIEIFLITNTGGFYYTLANSVKVKIVSLIILEAKHLITSFEVKDKLEKNDVIGAIITLVRLELTSPYFWEALLKAINYEYNVQLITDLVSSARLFLTYLDLVSYLLDVCGIDEDSYFYFKAPDNDISPPKVEILSPTSRNIQSNSVIPINVKITDNENVKKVKLIIDYNSKTPVAEYDFGNNAGKEKTYTFNWDNKGLLGTHYITIYGEDATGNSSSTLKIVNISNNPNDSTKPTVEIKTPAGNTIPQSTNVSTQIHLTDDVSIQFWNFSIENLSTKNLEQIYKETLTTTQKDITKDITINTSKYPVSTVLRFYIDAVDGNWNKTTFVKDFTVQEEQFKVILSEDFEKENLDPRISYFNQGIDKVKPGVVSTTHFGSSKAFTFGKSNCSANCYNLEDIYKQPYYTILRIKFPNPTYVSKITFKTSEIDGEWGSHGDIYLDSIKVDSNFGRIPNSTDKRDESVKFMEEEVNRIVTIIDIGVYDITNVSQILIDDLIIYGR